MHGKKEAAAWKGRGNKGDRSAMSRGAPAQSVQMARCKGVRNSLGTIFKVTTRHAVCAAVYLAENAVDKTVTADEISRNRNIPITYLPRILSKMAKAGIIKSFHGGREKGYRIIRGIGTISLFEIFDLFEGWSQKGCLLCPGDKNCDCAVPYYCETIKDRMFEPLRHVTLGDLCDRNQKFVKKKIMKA